VTPERLAVLAGVAEALPDLDRPLLVAVDGGDGAGKTRFAEDLAALLRDAGRAVVRASVDDFHHPRAHRHGLGRTGETVWARSFDYRALRQVLLDPWCAGAGSAYRCRHHDLATDALVDDPEVRVPDRGVLVVDGVFAQRAELRDCWDLVVWLEVSDEERVRRMAARDDSPTDPDHDDQRRYLDAHALYRAVADPLGSADLVVDNTDPDNPSIAGALSVPPGWHRTPHGLRRVVTTDAETAARINRLLEARDPG
jgi:uridine kinase